MTRVSYLFTCDANPDERWSDNVTAMLSHAIGELPLSYLVMMAGSPRVSRSTLWEDCLAITCRSTGAVERTLALFERIAAGDIADRAAFDQQLTQMRYVLSNAKLGPYVMLEVGNVESDEDADSDQEVGSL